MKTIAMIYRTEEKKWALSTWKGDIIPTMIFDNLMQAYAYAKRKKWGTKRIAECDARCMA